MSQGLIGKTETYKGYFQKKRSNAGWQRLTKTFGGGMKDNEKCFWNSGNEEEQEFPETLINDPRCLHSGDRCRSRPGSLTLVFQESFEMCPLLLQEGVRSISLLPLNLA